VNVYADESYREATGVYVVGAAFVPGLLNQTRNAAKQLLPVGRLAHLRPFHWRFEGEALKLRVLQDLIAARGITVHGYLQRTVTPRNQEATRRRLLSALLADAGRMGFRRLIIDQRNEQYKNDFDTSTVERSMKNKRVPQDFDHDFTRPSKEPLLWLPDSVCGALQADVSDIDPKFRVVIAGQLVVREFS
jgi:hypothetical protein